MASIQKRGGVWRAQVARKGQRINGTFDTRAEADDWAIRTEAALLAGVPKKSAGTTPKLCDLLLRYAAEVSPSKGGARWEQVRLASLARDPLFAVPIADADSILLATFRDTRLLTVQSSTVNRELNLVSAVFNHARREWRLGPPVNPVHEIARPKNPPKRKRRTSDEELELMAKALGWDRRSPPKTAGQWVAWCHAFAVHTAMRKGEIVSLMLWSNVHPRHVYLPKTKNDDARNVPLNKAAVALLAILQRGHGRVVGVGYGTADVLFRRARKTVGLDDLHFHDSRREGTTRHSKRLRNVLELQAVTGHRDLRVLKDYYAPDVEHLADILDGED